jgi:hypothetical protein
VGAGRHLDARHMGAMRGASVDGGRLGWEASVMRAANPRPKAAPAASSSYRRTDVRRVVADWGIGHRHTDAGQLPRPRQEESRSSRATYEEECAAACCRRHEAASEGRTTGTNFSVLRESTWVCSEQSPASPAWARLEERMRCQSDLLRAPLQMVAIGGLESGLLRNNNTSQRRWPGSEDPKNE